jgi:hypothetical protein
MIHPPAVVVVDDRENELNAIARALRSLDVACLPVLVDGVRVNLREPLSGVRLVFFDINYLRTVSNGTAMFEMAATVLLKVISKQNGPYVLVTWTSKSEDHEKLMMHFAQKVPEIPAPAVTMCLAKEKFNLVEGPDGKPVDDGATLRDEITKILSEHPQVAALMQWELSARTAAGDVVESLLEFFPREERFSGRCGPTLEQLLAHMAASAAGSTVASTDKRSALNEALIPILLDRMIHQKSDVSSALWDKAIGVSGAAQAIESRHRLMLNTLSHIALPETSPMGAGDRGVVFALSEDTGAAIAKRAAVSVESLISEYLEVSEGSVNRAPTVAEIVDCRWVLVGVRAVCDQAQERGKLRPLLLAMEIPGELKFGKGKGLRARSHGAALETPFFTPRSFGPPLTSRKLILNWHWQLSLGANDLADATLFYRLREPLVGQICTAMSAYLSRPGIINYE